MIAAFIKRLEDRAKRHFSLFDLGLLKLYGFIPGMLVGAYFSEWVKESLWIFVILFILLFSRFIYLLWIKK